MNCGLQVIVVYPLPFMHIPSMATSFMHVLCWIGMDKRSLLDRSPYKFALRDVNLHDRKIVT